MINIKLIIFSVPSGLDLVDNALKVANNFSKTKKTLENEIKQLKSKLNEKDETVNLESNERLKFNEGCFWMSKIIKLFDYFLIFSWKSFI